jgi:hypothetical protein
MPLLQHDGAISLYAVEWLRGGDLNPRPLGYEPISRIAILLILQLFILFPPRSNYADETRLLLWPSITHERLTHMITRSVLALSIVAALAAIGFTIALSAQSTTDAILPGCDIPKSYGKLVAVLPGSSGGAAVGTPYAVFEAEDGVIRWIAAVQAGAVMNTQTPPRGQLLPAFIQRYECVLGSEWKRH